MPDAQGSFKGISLSGVRNAWLDSLGQEADPRTFDEILRAAYEGPIRGQKRRRFSCTVPGCDYWFATSATTFSGSACPKHDALLRREVRLEEEMNVDLIEREHLRGITAPEF